MKKITTILCALCCAVGLHAQTVVATMQDLVDAATSKTATQSTDWQVSNENGGVYEFDGTSSYIGGITNASVVSALEGSEYVTIAMWVYGNTTSGGKCMFGYGDQSDGVKIQMTANCGGISATTKSVADMTTVTDSRISANQWTLVAVTFSGKAATTTGGRILLTGTDGTYWTKADYQLSNMKDPASDSKKFAIGSGNQGGARELFSGLIANVTVMTSSALLQNSAIAEKVGAAPTRTVSGLRDGIRERIDYVSAYLGDNPGYYSSATAQPRIKAGEMVLANESATQEELQTAYDNLNALTINMPKEGVLYQIVSAYPNYETNQHVKKAMCITTATISETATKVVGWATLNETEAQYFWRFTTNGSGYSVQNASDDTYMTTWNSNKQPLGETAVAISLVSLGNGQFNLKNGGSTMHTEGHSNGAGTSGPIVSWSGDLNSCSAWYIVEAEIKTEADITYRVMDGSNVLWSQTVEGVVGNAYPAPTFYNNFVTIPTPEGTVSAGETVDIPVSNVTVALPFDYGITVETAPAVALDVHGNEAKYPLYANGSNLGVEYAEYVNADDYTQGAVKSDAYAWKLVGDPFGGFRLYNVSTGTYAVHASDADQAITLGSDGTVFQIYNSRQGSNDAFDSSQAFCLKKADYAYYLNHRGTQLQAWNENDGGSSFRAYTINVQGVSYSLTMAGQYATVCLPFYSVVPEGITLYKNSAVAEDNTLTLVAVASGSMLMPNTPYIVEATQSGTYVFSNTSATTSDSPVTEGNLTGVLAAAGASVPEGGYVLARNKETGHQAFYLTDGSVTCPQYKCYLTLSSVESAPKAVYFPGEVQTGIDGLFGSEENGKVTIFNLAGQQLNKLERGINIVNGRKVLVK